MDFHQSTAAGLMRFRSSPGTLLTGHLAEEAVNDDSSASDHAFARFLSGESPSLTSESRDFRSHENSNNKEDSNHHHHRVGHFPATSTHMYQTVNRSDRSGGTSLGILSMEAAGAIKSSGVGLVRHSSSPAGLFSHITADNGFSVMRSTRSFGNGSMAESDPNRLKSQLSFPARQPTSGRFMSQIPELGGDTMASNSSDDDGLLATGRGGYLSGFTVSSWDESNTVAGMQSPDLMGRKRVRDHLDSKLMAGGFNITHSQKGDKLSHHPAGLTHHFSLPKTLPDMAAVEKYLQMHDSVPCKVRAKRGCATHPRSIAERVRRTRISERMRKLQELVPNMDKQTNTADMLDLAVDHIKELQKKVQALSESRSSCTCGSKHNPYGF